MSHLLAGKRSRGDVFDVRAYTLTHLLKSLVDFELCLPGLFSAFVSKLVGMANVHVHFTLFLSLVFDLMSDLVIDLCISA
jgi:hypothetical protein